MVAFMKKFQFSLENVLNYKNQVLDALQGEHAALMARVHEQEKVVQSLEQEYQTYNEEYREKKRTGMTIVDAMGYEQGLRTIETQIQRETEKLEARKKAAEKKRAEVVAARQDSASIEKLKEKKLSDYQKLAQKDDEQSIEEFVSAARSRAVNL
jgi:flagellar FliJ protein